MAGGFQVSGHNPAAPFSLKMHRGEGMVLVAMNWKKGKPPLDFVGFAIEYKEPGGDRFFALKNRLAFPLAGGAVNANTFSTRLSPIQKFRWIHFPRNADMPGEFTYRVTPVFMNALGELSYGEPQVAAIELRGETFLNKINVAFSRGFVSSQAFVDRFVSKGPISTLLPASSDEGLGFVPTHPQAGEALAWMGFEARSAIIEVLDRAIADTKAKVRVIAYDLNEPGIVTRLEKLGTRLRIIVDDSDAHGEATSGETQAAARLVASAGAANLKRHHVGQLQHNKVIVVDGPKGRAAVCGSTNFSWRGFFVQANNAVVLRSRTAVTLFADAFERYFAGGNSASAFAATPSSVLTSLGISQVDASVAFSPHAGANAMLATIAADIDTGTTSSLFYSLAFLFQTPGAMQNAIRTVMADTTRFVVGISDKKVGGLDVQTASGTVSPVFSAALEANVPEPFKSEPKGGGGTRMHHKFVVIDFDKPTARVYLGSYNFSATADTKNGENLLVIRNRRIAVAYMVEALRIFDHYEFRVVQDKAGATKKLQLKKPPSTPGAQPWWAEDYTNPRKIKDRELFS